MQAGRWTPAFVLFVAAAFGQTPTLLVDGGNGTVVKLSMADLRKMPQHTVNATEDNHPVRFEGVYLGDVLAKVGAPSGKSLQGKTLSTYLSAEAVNGGRMVFGLTEFDPLYSNRIVLLATRREGKPLNDKDGPFELVVPDEKQPSRWVKKLVALKVRTSS